MDLAPLNERGLPEDRPRGFVEGWRAVENHQEAAVRAQPAALEIREQALTHGRVLGRASRIHDATLKAGTFLGAVPASYGEPGPPGTGRPDFSDWRFFYDGPAFDGHKTPP